MKSIQVGKSSIHGRGVFVTRKVAKGDIISRLQGEMRMKKNRSVQDALANPDWVGIAKNRWIDPIPPYKYINHSCEPSAGIKGTVTMVALRDLKPRDEITIDYSTIEEDKNWHMRCSCGSRKCRKIIRSMEFLPEKKFKAYLPYIPTYFTKIYTKRFPDVAKSMVR